MADIHYVDSHAHIMGEEFDADRDELIQRTEEKNVDQIMIITLSVEEAKQAIEFAKRNPKKYVVATGIFPDDAPTLTQEQWDAFEEIARLPQISVIGEIGLDYHWDKDPNVHALQRDLFIRQITLANQLHKPIAVHSRDASQDTYDILAKNPCRGLLHCFSGSKEMAIEYTKLGYFLAFGGALTFKNARHAIDAVATVDEKWLLTETDCPYMAPVPVRGTRNEPANIPYILQKMAEVRNTSVEHMANVVETNWQRYLGREQ